MNILQKWQVEKDKKNLSLLTSELKKLNLSKKVFELYEMIQLKNYTIVGLKLI